MHHSEERKVCSTFPTKRRLVEDMGGKNGGGPSGEVVFSIPFPTFLCLVVILSSNAT